MNVGARMTALERRQTNLETRVEELAQDVEVKHTYLYNDMSANFRQVAEYFLQIEGRLDNIEATMATKDDLEHMATKDDLTAIEKRFDLIESTMATKQDLEGMATKQELSNMETRILDAFQQLVTIIRPENSSSQQ
jgi:hypothetical protein